MLDVFQSFLCFRLLLSTGIGMLGLYLLELLIQRLVLELQSRMQAVELLQLSLQPVHLLPQLPRVLHAILQVFIQLLIYAARVQVKVFWFHLGEGLAALDEAVLLLLHLLPALLQFVFQFLVHLYLLQELGADVFLLAVKLDDLGDVFVALVRVSQPVYHVVQLSYPLLLLQSRLLQCQVCLLVFLKLALKISILQLQ